MWFDPELWVALPTSRIAAARSPRQYFEYGRWKREVLRRHPDSLRWRQVVPPLATGAAVVGVVAAPWVRRALVLPGVYAAAVGVAAISAGRLQPSVVGRLLAIFPTIHFSWSAGLVTPFGRFRRRPSRCD